MNTSIRRALRVPLVALSLVMAGCASTSTVSLDADTIEIAVHVATICDANDAARLARRQAAVETIRRGFDEFVVVDSVRGDHPVDQPPVTARTTLYGDSTTPIFSEDAPLVAHHRVLTVRMFPAGAGGSDRAVDARTVLGDDWESVAAKGAPNTCIGIGG